MNQLFYNPRAINMQKKYFKKETEALTRIAEASNAIRRKHRMIKSGRETVERAMREVLQPVINPLEKLTDSSTEKEMKIKEEIKTKKEPKLSSSIDVSQGDDLYATAAFSGVKNEEFPASTTIDKILPFQMQLQNSSQEPKTPIKSDLPIETSTPTENISSSRLNASTSTEQFVQKYIRTLKNSQIKNKGDLDTDFGVRSLEDGFRIGNSEVTFHKNSMNLRNKSYSLTPGLVELIFKKSPNMSLVTGTDEGVYAQIIEDTNAHRLYYRHNEALRQNNTVKCKTIIEKMFPSSSKKSGTSLPHHMIASKNPKEIDYIYWDDPNELVERLQLLTASQSAGNMSHTNEIISILEELREAHIIY